MRDIGAELKSLRLYGMAGAWSDLEAQRGGMSLDTSRWLIEHLLQAESDERIGQPDLPIYRCVRTLSQTSPQSLA